VPRGAVVAARREVAAQVALAVWAVRRVDLLEMAPAVRGRAQVAVQARVPVAEPVGAAVEVQAAELVVEGVAEEADVNIPRIFAGIVFCGVKSGLKDLIGIGTLALNSPIADLRVEKRGELM
jgi:hypothetical protein